MRHPRNGWLALVGAMFAITLAWASPAWAADGGDDGNGRAAPAASTVHRPWDTNKATCKQNSDRRSDVRPAGQNMDTCNGYGNGDATGNGNGNGNGNGTGTGTGTGSGNGTGSGSGNGTGGAPSSPAASAAPTSALPTTGTEVGGLVVVGLGMVGAGGTLLWLRRRRDSVEFMA